MQANNNVNAKNNRSDDKGQGAPSIAAAPGSDDDQRVLFPQMLHRLLCESETRGTVHLVSWLSCGKIFKVHHRDGFVKQVLPVYFRQTRYKSFVRQLNLWGYTCVSSGIDKGSYFHDNFIRSDPDLCFEIRRVKIKGAAAAVTKANRSKSPPQRLARYQTPKIATELAYKPRTSTADVSEPSRMILRERKVESKILEDAPNPTTSVQSKISDQDGKSDDQNRMVASKQSPRSFIRSFDFPPGGLLEETIEPLFEDCFLVLDDEIDFDLGLFD